MLELCRHYRTPVIVNSDAHCEADSGNHASAYALLEELDFPQELVSIHPLNFCPPTSPA